VRELEERLGVTVELPVRELIERGAEPLAERENALALDIGGGSAAQLGVLQRHLARQRHRAPEADQAIVASPPMPASATYSHTPAVIFASAPRKRSS
jgi:hypothetical protein